MAALCDNCLGISISAVRVRRPFPCPPSVSVSVSVFSFIGGFRGENLPGHYKLMVTSEVSAERRVVPICISREARKNFQFFSHLDELSCTTGLAIPAMMHLRIR